jgi:magnesium-protoporphyrin O-methyltransferase
VFTHPPRNRVSRAFVATQNLLFRLLGREFRVFVHPPEAMLAVLAVHGLQTGLSHGGPVWQVSAASR